VIPRHHHGLERGLRADRLDDTIALVRGDEHARRRVLELALELHRLVHGVEADENGAGLHGAVVRDGELRVILEEDRHAVARPDPAGREPAGEAVARLLGQPDPGFVEPRRPVFDPDPLPALLSAPYPR
jgi:hypothetical protein